MLTYSETVTEPYCSNMERIYFLRSSAAIFTGFIFDALSKKGSSLCRSQEILRIFDIHSNILQRKNQVLYKETTRCFLLLKQKIET